MIREKSLVVAAIAVALGGCAPKDPCAAVAGSCLTVTVSSRSVTAVDALDVSASGAADGMKTSSLGGRHSLPVRFALTIADSSASGPLHLAISAKLGGAAVGFGSADVELVAGQHRDLPVDVEASGSAADDLSQQSPTDMGGGVDGGLGVGAPRLIGPMSGTIVTTPRPTVRWQLAPGTTEPRVEFCVNRQFQSLAATATIDASGASAQPDSDLPAGVVFWRVSATTASGTLTSPIWSFTAPKRVGTSQTVNASWGHVLDINGDGFADLAVTAPGVMINGVQVGRIYVYTGSTAGIQSSTSPTTIDGLDGALSSTTLVASAGDLNGDGYADLLYRGGSAHAYVFNGGATGITDMATPSAMLKTVDKIAGVGDLDGDGYGDVAVAAAGVVSVYYGSGVGLAATARTTLDGTDANGGTAPTGFGGSLAAAGDVNGDGFADILIGATGQAFIYLGGKAKLTPLPPLKAVAANDTLDASAAAGIGDINGDGYPDVLVGGSSNHTDAAFVFLGGATAITPGQVLVGPNGSGFGTAFAGIADLDGDGYDDVVVGAPFLPGTSSVPGAAYVYTSNGSMLTAFPVLTGPTADNSNYGEATAGGGDINADGHSDFIVAAPQNNTVWLYYGPWTPSQIVTLTGSVAGSLFGYSVAQ